MEGEMDSILDSVKKLLGIPKEIDDYDIDVIMHINSVFFILYQMGVGDKAYVLHDNTETWADFFGDLKENEAVKMYVYYKVRILFDPPSSSFVLEAMNKAIQEYEFRINLDYDPRNP